MRPVAFDYTAPRYLEEVLLALKQSSPTVLLAGGQSLLPELNLRNLRPALVVDINSVSELQGTGIDNNVLRLGALTRQRQLECNNEIASFAPALAEAAALIGDPGVRRRGTLGGSLAQAQPGAELPTVAVLLDAQIEIAGPSGMRTVRARDFFLGPSQTALQTGEVLVAVRTTQAASGESFAIRKLPARHYGRNYTAASRVRRDDTGCCTSAALVFNGAKRPYLVPTAMKNLIGTRTLPESHSRALAAQAVAEIADCGEPPPPQDRALVEAAVCSAFIGAWARIRDGVQQ
ncbi:FAD binding domain-containing protein [Streptomyces collinus]|uniref:FAD binding domain-containing protein n=1 Tax=Streptomyces collinus TaxID=42684 RepID=UPI0036C6182B